MMTEMEQDCVSLTVGLLGATLPNDGRMIQDFDIINIRFLEIERRIIEIEEQLSLLTRKALK